MLEKYCDSPKIDAYAKLIGEVNLVAAWVHQQMFDHAKPLLKRLHQTIETSKLRRLERNLWELELQISIAAKDFERAEHIIEKLGNPRSRSIDSLDELYISKWIWAMELERNTRPKRLHLAHYRRLKAAAEVLNDGETQRELDRLALMHFLKEGLLEKLLVGTPYTAYANALVKELRTRSGAKDLEWPLLYRGFIGNEQHNPTTSSGLLDLTRGTWNKTAFPFQLNSAPMRVVLALFADLYNTRTLPALFSQVFEDEHYNPFTSPNRLHQLLSQLRKVFAEMKIPITISSNDTQVQVLTTSPSKYRA